MTPTPIESLRLEGEVKVKPLEWTCSTEWKTGEFVAEWFVFSVAGHYRLWHDDTVTPAVWHVSYPVGSEQPYEGTEHPSIEAAKAAAQSDYDARIRSALVSDKATAGEVWQPIATADKDAERLTLGIFRNGKLSEIHVGGYRYAYDDDEVSCWWSEQADDEIVPTHWMHDLSSLTQEPTHE